MPEQAIPIAPSRESQIARAVDQFMADHRLGQLPSVEEFAARNPEIADELRRVLPALAMLGSSEPHAHLAGPDSEHGALGDFRLIREVGRGGMGIVYEAEQISLNRRVALKVLPFAATMDPRHLQRFRNEAQAAACLHHPNIVPVHGVGVERGVHYYAMQLIEGQTLAEVIAEIREEQELNHSGTEDTEKREKTVPKSSLCSLCLCGKKSSFFRHIAELIADAADALEYAHSMGVVHRDIDSLDRIVLAGDMSQYPIQDFAVARLTVAGALDSGFDGDGRQTLGLTSQSDAQGRSVAVDSVGRIVVAGFASNGTNSDCVVARYTPAGAPDTTFGGTGIVIVATGTACVAVDSLDRVVVAGTTEFPDHFLVARLTAAGALDSSFDGDGYQTIDFGTNGDRAIGVAIDSLDRVVVAGTTGDYDFAVARLTVAGALDASFDSDGKQTIDFGASDDGAVGVVVDSQDRVVVAGSTGNGPNVAFAIVRLTVSGTLDASFDSDGRQTIAFGGSNNYAYGVAIDSLDRVVVVGHTEIYGTSDFALVRLTVAGALDAGFDSDGKQVINFGASYNIPHGVAVDSADRIVVVGSAGSDFAVARLTVAGTLDAGFDSDGKQIIDFGGSDVANSVALASADRVVLAGKSSFGSTVFAVARLTGDTTTATAQVNDGSVQRSMVTSIPVTFSSPVTFAGAVASAFTLTRNGGGSVNFTTQVEVINGGTVVTLTNFSGSETQFGSLRDGRYTLTALASQISANGQPLDGDANGTFGGNFVFGEAQGLFRFFADINGDRHVDIADFGLFSSTFNLSTGQTGFIAAFDFNGDGHIDIADFGQFSIRFFTPLP